MRSKEGVRTSWTGLEEEWGLGGWRLAQHAQAALSQTQADPPAIGEQGRHRWRRELAPKGQVLLQALTAVLTKEEVDRCCSFLPLHSVPYLFH